MFGFLGKKDGVQQGDSVSLDVSDPRDVDSHCLISGNLQIKGDVYFSGSLRIDGRVDGKIAVYEGRKGKVIVSQNAVVNGPIIATNVLADGLINGTMDVLDKLECRAHAVIRGQVTYGRMDIADGALIEARCRKREVNERQQRAGRKLENSFLATKKK